MGAKILVVEDSEVVQSAATMVLRQARYQVMAASNGREGLLAAQRESFDLVLSDLMMPEMDGIEMTSALRGLPGYANTPIIILTTEARALHAKRALEAGASVWLLKPIAGEPLLRSIHNLLNGN